MNLEEEVEKLDRQEKQRQEASKERESVESQKKNAQAKTQFRKDFNKYFGELRSMVEVDWAKYCGNKAHFVFKGKDYYIAYEFWERESIDVDDHYTSGYRWKLFPSHNGYNFGNDYSLTPERGLADVISGLLKIEKGAR